MKKILLFSTFLLLLTAASFAQTTRTQLYEEFTGENCGPCAASNPTLNTLLASNTPGMISLKYESPIPSSAGANSIYGHNTTDVDNRITYYTVPFAPYGRQDGFQIPDPNNQSNGHVAFLTQSVITSRASATSPFSLAITHVFNTAFDSVTVTAVITAAQAYTAVGTLKFRLALTEKAIHLIAPTGSNGEKDFFNTMRRMIPDYSGTTIASTWVNAATQTLTFKIAIPNYIYDFSQIEFVGFIQDDGNLGTGNYNIQQAALSAQIAVPSTLKDGGIANNTVAPTNLCSTSVTPTFTFTNNSTSPITSAVISYTINGGAPVTQNYTGPLAAGASATITFPTATLSPGSVSIVGQIVSINGIATGAFATVGDYNGTNNVSDAVNFSVVPSTTVGTSISQDFESVTKFTIGAAIPNAVNVNPSGDDVYVVDKTVSTSATANLGGYANSNNSLRFRFPTFKSLTDVASVVFEKIDLTGKTNVGLSFSYSYARWDANSTDALNVSVSTNCGTSWTQVWSKSGSALATAPDVSGAYFYPTATQWATGTVDLSAYNNAPELMVKFDGVEGAGNNLYLDDINLRQGALGVSNITAVNQINIYPNPAKNQATIELSLASAVDNASIIVTDIAGKTLIQNELGKVSTSVKSALNTESLTSGLYLVHFVANGKEISVQKLNVVK